MDNFHYWVCKKIQMMLLAFCYCGWLKLFYNISTEIVKEETKWSFIIASAVLQWACYMDRIFLMWFLCCRRPKLFDCGIFAIGSNMYGVLGYNVYRDSEVRFHGSTVQLKCYLLVEMIHSDGSLYKPYRISSKWFLKTECFCTFGTTLSCTEPVYLELFKLIFGKVVQNLIQDFWIPLYCHFHILVFPFCC